MSVSFSEHMQLGDRSIDWANKVALSNPTISLTPWLNKAIRHYQAASESEPTSQKALLCLAHAFAKRDENFDWANALSNYNDARGLSSSTNEEKSFISMRIGEIWLKTDRWNVIDHGNCAIDNFQEAIRLNPEFPKFYLLLAETYNLLGKKAEARDAAKLFFLKALHHPHPIPKDFYTRAEVLAPDKPCVRVDENSYYKHNRSSTPSDVAAHNIMLTSMRKLVIDTEESAKAQVPQYSYTLPEESLEEYREPVFQPQGQTL